MSNQRPSGVNDKDNDDRSDKDGAVAKAAGFVVFSGIAMSILKALNPWNSPNLKLNSDNATSTAGGPPSSSTQPLQQSRSHPPPESITKKPISGGDKNAPNPSQRTIEIVRGDTLWGISRKYGVSVQAIKEANGLTGDTIYAGKKLVIP